MRDPPPKGLGTPPGGLGTLTGGQARQVLALLLGGPEEEDALEADGLVGAQRDAHPQVVAPHDLHQAGVLGGGKGGGVRGGCWGGKGKGKGVWGRWGSLKVKGRGFGGC